MHRYKSLSGHSGIRAFDIKQDSIKIEFNDGSIYLYDDKKPGPVHLAQMKKLAIKGQGLTTYINKWVRQNFAAKLK